MLRKFLKPYWLLLLALGCERGCTCSHDRTLETESEKRTIDGVKFEIAAKHIRTKTATVTWSLRCTEGNHYWVGFDLELPKRPPAVNILALPTGESVDLESYLPMCEVRFSPEKKHFLVLYEQKMYKLYHLLPEGTPFSYTPFAPDSLKIASNFWAKIPPADSIAVQIVRGEVVFNSEDEKLLQQSLSEQPIGNFYDSYLVSLFPQNSFAVQLFGEERSKKLAKNTEWKEGIIKRIFQAIERKEYGSEASQMVLYLADNELFVKIDPLMVARWTGENTEKAEKIFEELTGKTVSKPQNIPENYPHHYLVERLHDRKQALSEYAQKTLQSHANRFLEQRNVDFLEKSYEVLRLLEDDSRMEKSLNGILENDFFTQNPLLVKGILENNYAFFSKNLKSTALTKSKKLLETTPDLWHKQLLLEFVKGKITCEEFWAYQDRFFGQEEVARVYPPQGCEK